MKKLVALTALASLGLMIVVDPAVAQDAAGDGAEALALAKASASGLKGIGGGLAAGIGALGAGVGIGRIGGSAVEAIAPPDIYNIFAALFKIGSAATRCVF